MCERGMDEFTGFNIIKDLPTGDFREKEEIISEGEEYIRVDGNMVCETCGLEYRKHPREFGFTEMSEEVTFIRLCNGQLGKP